jgi:hypothetical protein
MVHYCRKIILLIPVLCILLTGCINLKHISSYAEASSITTIKVRDSDYNFLQYCLDRCEIAAIDSFRIYRAIPCTCAPYKKADSVTRAISSVIAAYFDGLNRLSNNKKINYRVDPLAKTLQDKELGILELKKEEAEAYTLLGDILLHAFTDTYRQQKIRAYIKSANAPLQKLLEKLEFIETYNLKGLFTFKRERLYYHYHGLLSESKLSDYEKQNAAREYYGLLNEIDTQEQQMGAFARGLKSIGKGHEKLFEHVNEISAADLKNTLQQYTDEINTMLAIIK